jgi:hypothetical protein
MLGLPSLASYATNIWSFLAVVCIALIVQLRGNDFSFFGGRWRSMGSQLHDSTEEMKGEKRGAAVGTFVLLMRVESKKSGTMKRRVCLGLMT